MKPHSHMQTSIRSNGFEGGYKPKRSHGPQLSISDDNHHVTEAIGDMYGENDYPAKQHEARPLSFLPGTSKDSIEHGKNEYYNSVRSKSTRSARSGSNDRMISSPLTNGQPTSPPLRTTSLPQENGAHLPSSSSPSSPPHTSSPPQVPVQDSYPPNTAQAHFPLDNDYQSDPAAVQKELINLQAIRRMSMDVNGNGTRDPDLPSFNSGFMPAMSPGTPTADENGDQASRMYWVPARIHPELAPLEFKTFLENRVDQIKRRSGDSSSLGLEGLERHGSGSSLRRKKSMLSRQVDNAGGKAAESYRDGAERLEKKRSLSGPHSPDLKVLDFEDAEGDMSDASRLMRKLSVVTAQSADGEGSNDDMPILAPHGRPLPLKRSTRTTYRRGSLRNGERVRGSSRRGLSSRNADTDTDDSPLSSPVGSGMSSSQKISRLQTEPVPPLPRDEPIESFSRPLRSAKGGPVAPVTAPSDDDEQIPASPTSFKERVLDQERAMNGRSRSSQHSSLMEHTVPEIIETPPEEEVKSASEISTPPPSQSYTSLPPPPQARPGKHRPSALRPGSSGPRKSDQTLNDIVSQPSPLPGNSTRTDNLSFIPTFNDDKKSEKKSKTKERENGEGTTQRKSGWSGWFSGDKQHKDKDSQTSKKGSIRRSKSSEKSQDDTRLDVLQKSIDGGRGRESLVLDRDNIKLEEERKKESSRKSSGDKAKESSLLSSIFGGSKKKGDKDSSKSKSRGLSPEPPPRLQRPDIDYRWTRFPLIEERAIYRMAHIKLANPRRALYSQVLLSNFMYSYLDKVQAMQQHPQQISSAQTEEQNRAQGNNVDTQEQQESQYYQSQEQSSESTTYVDDAEIYDHDHPSAGGAAGGYSHQQQQYHQYEQQPYQHNSKDDEMW